MHLYTYNFSVTLLQDIYNKHIFFFDRVNADM